MQHGNPRQKRWARPGPQDAVGIMSQLETGIITEDIYLMIAYSISVYVYIGVYIYIYSINIVII